MLCLTNPKSDCTLFSKFLDSVKLDSFTPLVDGDSGRGQNACRDTLVKSPRIFLFYCFSSPKRKEFSREPPRFPRTRPDNLAANRFSIFSARNLRFTKCSNCFPRDFSCGGSKRSERGHALPFSPFLSLLSLSGKAKRRWEGISIRFFVSRLFFHPRFFFSSFFHSTRITYVYTRIYAARICTATN